MRLHSLYTPDGAFQLLLVALLVTLLGALAYLLLFTTAGVS